MSADLFVRIPARRVLEFSLEGCARFMSRYGFGLSFPEGFDIEDQAGFVPCLLSGLERGEVETGFESFDVSEGDDREFVWTVSSGGDGFDWMLAHAMGAYCVSELSGVLEDPQEGESWGADDVSVLDGVVMGLLGEAGEQ